MKPRDPQGDPACIRLLCASQWSPEGSAIQAMLAQREHWLRHAHVTGLRTALLYVAGWLVQWHEGTAEAVDEQWRQLRDGSAGRAVRLLHRSEGPSVLQAGVQVTSLHAAEGPADVARRLRSVERESQEAPLEPVDLWHALCAPCQLGRPGSLGFARRDMVAVASEDNEAVDLLRVLAQDRGLRIAYQRYAGTDLRRADVGASYLDVALEENAVTRVHALPRRSLVASVPMLGLRDVKVMVLLLGTNMERASTLLDEAKRLLTVLPRPPAVVVACTDPQVRGLAQMAIGEVPGAQVVDIENRTPGRGCAELVSQLVALREGGLRPASAPAGTAANQILRAARAA